MTYMYSLLHFWAEQVLASEIPNLKTPIDGHGKGIDHKAICWCHNVLVLVRSLINYSALNEAANANANDRFLSLYAATKTTRPLGSLYSEISGNEINILKVRISHYTLHIDTMETVH